MKLLLVFALLAVSALAKPVEKPKRQLDGFSFVPPIGRNVNQFGARSFPTQFGVEGSQFEQTPTVFLNQASNEYNLGSNGLLSSSGGAVFDQAYTHGISSLNNAQPEITNVGNSGLNSNEIVSTTTVSPLPVSLDSFSLPTSTISPLIGSEINTINAGSTFGSLSSGSLASSGLLTQNLASPVTPVPEISSTFSSSSNSLNVGPTALPILTSSAAPSVQARFGSDNIFLENSFLQDFGSSSLNLNELNFQPKFDLLSNVNSDSYLTVSADKSPEVTKSVYFYDAPEELEPIRQRKIVQLPPQKTNYKILFIKAPSAPEPQPIEIPAQIQNNEKTRVYVLVKKPETEQQVRIVSAPAPKPEKPEVFYIKYRNQEEAEKAIKEAQEGAALGQESLSVNGQQLVSSIKNAKVSHTDGNLLVKQTISQSVPLNLFESSTALPFVSTTGVPFISTSGALGNIYDSSTASSILNHGGLNQLSLYNTPVLSKSNNLIPFSGKNLYTTGNNLFSSGNNLFSTRDNLYPGNLGFRSNNIGSFGSLSFSPNAYISSSFSNVPSFVDLSQRSNFGFRSGRIDNSEEKKDSTSTSSPVVSSETTEKSTDAEESSEQSSTNIKDEPLLLALGGSESSSSSPAYTNSVETSSSTVATEIDSTTISE